MAITTPRTWVTGELVSAAIMNSAIRDNMNALIPLGWTVMIDGGGATLTAGSKAFVEIPINCCLQTATLAQTEASNLQVNIAKVGVASFPPLSTVAGGHLVHGSSPLMTASAKYYQLTTLTTWAPSLAAGDWMGYFVCAVSGVAWAAVGLRANRT